MTSSSSSISSSFFTCPISYDVMTDPVIDPCGHTFERPEIEGWLNAGNANCPLSRRPMSRADLVPNRIVKSALEVLSHASSGESSESSKAPADEEAPPISFSDRLALLIPDPEERELVQAAMQRIENQRAQDRINGIPNQLPQRQSFVNKVKDFYGC